jgi:hypothetical protein
MPVATGNNQYQILDFGLTTAGDFMENQKTVLGKMSGMEEDSAIFVVIALKVLDYVCITSYATGCGSGRTPNCRRQRSIHCLVSFSCTPFCESRVRRLLQSTWSSCWS